MTKKTFFTFSMIIIFYSSLLTSLPFKLSNSKEGNLSYEIVLANSDYIWIWDEFEGSPGDLPGNDIANWDNSLGPYHNRTELVSKFSSLETNFPDLIDISDIGTSYQGNNIPLVIITIETSEKFKKEFFLVAHHHARESITIENALYFIDKLVYDFTNDDEAIQEMLNERTIYVVPSLNIDSLDILYLWPEMRKNYHPIDEDDDGVEDENELITGVDSDDPDETIAEDKPGGVDLNRNYAYQWGYPYGNSDNVTHETYRGEEPFSEPETLALANFVRQHYFQAAVSLHSGVELIITPWSYDSSYSCPDEEIYDDLGNELASLTGFTHEYLYPCAGEWGDWMYSARGIVSVTLETFHGDDWTYLWDGFNPHANGVISNCQNIVYPGLLYMATYDRPNLAINPSENISSIISEPPEPIGKTGFNVIFVVPSFLSFIVIIMLIRKRKK
ncbi:MAG: hypothetical protein HZR80_17275 [Candidatus Heimdallarchaeota archaeon]